MGLEHLKAHRANGKLDWISVPPGFVSLTSFSLKRVENEEATFGTMASGSASEIQPAGTKVVSTVVDAATLKSSLKCRPWIIYDQSNQNQEESDSEQLDMDIPSKTSLPKGVINGCPECSGCVKVIARWQPENARTEVLEDAPVFHPTEEEFSDTVKYIASIRPRAEPYGICRIVPPSSWQPPCAIKEKNGGSKFVANIQRIDGRQNQHSKNKVGTSFKSMNSRRKRRQRMGSGYRFYDGFSRNLDEVGNLVIEDFNSEPGPKFSLEAFKKYADSFKQQYFCRTDKVLGSDDYSTLLQKQWKPSVESVEGEYRRIIENPTEEIEVLYGSDLKADVFGSGFPTVPSSVDISSTQDYLRSGWNLSNTPRLPGSLLCFESCDTSGVLVPRLHIGMCFSSIGWNVEDHHLYSLSYMHFGDPKVRYAIPVKYAIQVDVALKKHFPNLWSEQPGLRHKLDKSGVPMRFYSIRTSEF